jgi:hypothetical protein
MLKRNSERRESGKPLAGTVGRGFNPYIKPEVSRGAFSPEVCFAEFRPKTWPLSAASLPNTVLHPFIYSEGPRIFIIRELPAQHNKF